MKSVINKIIEKIYVEKSLENGKKICITTLTESQINNHMKKKMINEINNVKSLIKLQTYMTNCLLRFEGLSVNKYKKK